MGYTKRTCRNLRQIVTRNSAESNVGLIQLTLEQRLAILVLCTQPAQVERIDGRDMSLDESVNAALTKPFAKLEIAAHKREQRNTRTQVCYRQSLRHI